MKIYNKNYIHTALGKFFTTLNYFKNSFLAVWVTLSVPYLSFAQETEAFVDPNFTYECDCKNWSDGLSISLGASFNSPQNIGDYLSQFGVSDLPSETLWFGIGWSFRSDEDQHIFDFLAGLGDASSTNEDFKLRYRENDIMLRYYRKLFSSEAGSSIGVGGQTSYHLASIQINQRTTMVDLEGVAFTPNSQNLSSNSWRFGPTINFNWITGEKQKLLARFIFSYDFSLFTSKWRVEDAITLTDFEDTKDRIQLSVLIPLFTR